MKPIGAVKDGDDLIKKMEGRVKETKEDVGRAPPKVYKVRDTAQVKIPEGVLDKQSYKSWSSSLHKKIKNTQQQKIEHQNIKYQEDKTMNN